MKAEDLYEAMGSIRMEYLEESEMQMKKKKLPRRTLLVAAVIGAMGIVGAAVSFSLRGVARADVGVDATRPLPEWTEYEVEGEKDTGAVQPQPVSEPEEHEWEPEGGWQDSLTLDSTLCSGEVVTAYIRVAGISPEIAASLAQRGGEYYFDIGSLDANGEERSDSSCGVSYVSYDEAAQTALIRVDVHGVAEDCTEIRYSPTLCRGAEPRPVVYYEDVIIPVTPSSGLHAKIDMLFPQGDYRGEMRAVEATVCAGYVDIAVDVTPLREIADEGVIVPVKRTQIPHGERVTVPDAMLDAIHENFISWWDRGDAALADVQLHYRDGTTQTVKEDLPSAYAADWVVEGGLGGYEECCDIDRISLRYVTTQAIDLRQVVSITVGGVEYPLTGEAA